mmetsp:Transcript_19869/g.47727  ORF Transcript_19869/g.47727 Transcript_19869/m.47727 type:complete len:83 (+) Transcript_19869:434-682(+)
MLLPHNYRSAITTCILIMTIPSFEITKLPPPQHGGFTNMDDPLILYATYVIEHTTSTAARMIVQHIMMGCRICRLAPSSTSW